MKLFFIFLFFALIFYTTEAQKLPQIEILVEKKSICMKEIETLDKCVKNNKGAEGKILKVKKFNNFSNFILRP
jgi:hypothetical protein